MAKIIFMKLPRVQLKKGKAIFWGYTVIDKKSNHMNMYP